MNQIREILKINEEELSRGLAGTSASWHTKYANSAWVFVGNLDVKLTEGDVIAVISEYGEIDDFHLVREEDTGKSKGFAFCKYEDARSCVIAVDNLGGVKLCGRSLRVDHVENYRLPKNLQDKEEELQQLLLKKQGLQGHAYEGKELANEFSLHQGQDVFAKPPPKPKETLPEDVVVVDDNDIRKKEEKQKRKKEKQREKEQRKREREEKRMEREEKRREKRAKKMQNDDGSYKDDDKNKRDDERKNSKRKHKSREHKSKRPEKERKKQRRSSRSPSPSRQKSHRTNKSPAKSE